MKTITLPQEFADAIASPLQGRGVEYVVCVEWFPPLTPAQQLTNAVALSRGERPPHPDPNVIVVRCPSATTLTSMDPVEKGDAR